MENKKNISSSLISGLIMILVGILFIIFQGKVLSILFTIIGVLLIAYGIIDLINHKQTSGLIKVLVGVLIIVFGWVLVSVCLYIFGALLIIFGVLNLVQLFRQKAHGTKPLITILLYLSPILDILCGIFLIINQIKAIDYAFIFFGIILIIDGMALALSSQAE